MRPFPRLAVVAATTVILGLLSIPATADLFDPPCQKDYGDNWRAKRLCVKNVVDGAALDCFRRNWQAYAAVSSLPHDAQVAGAKVVFNYNAAWNEVMLHDSMYKHLAIDHDSLMQRHCTL